MGQKGSGLKNIKCLRQFSHISSNYFIFGTDMIKSGKTNKKNIEK